MKHIALTILIVGMILVSPLTVLATELPHPDDSTSIAITVVVPRPESSHSIKPEPSFPQTLPPVYPIHVWESNENGRREIVRVYELREHETSTQISREPFIRDGFRFELAEIIRREIPSHSTREHTKIITVNTQTNDLSTILSLLSSTLDFMSPDGYFGVLSLDVSTIRVESQGTRSSSHAVTRTREFPHLSSADTSLIPRTITESGRTYNLTNVEWRTLATSTVDYTQLASSFTAIATFTGTATHTSTIGYTTAAEYRGQISKLSIGRQEFTAHFIGIPIVIPTVEVVREPASEETSTTSATNSLQYVDEATKNTSEVETCLTTGKSEKPKEVETVEQINLKHYDETSGSHEMPGMSSEENPSRRVSLPAAIILMAVCSVIAYFVGKKGKEILAIVCKISCVLLCFGLTFGIMHQVYAAQLPDNPFGVQGSGEIHFNPNAEQGSPPQEIQVMHFAPNAAPIKHFNPSISNDYEYGEHVGVLTIYRLGRNINVFAGATMESMDYGAGHFSFTGLNFGNTGLIGHNRGPAGFFNFVRYLRYGDILYFEANGVIRRYVVVIRYIIDETNFDSLMQFGDNRLTLITCVEYQRTQRRVAVALEI